SGRWDVRVRRPGAPSLAVTLDHGMLDRLPVETTVDGRRYEFREQGYDVPVVEVHSDLRPNERGPYRQSRIRLRHYRAPRRLRPLRPAVLYDSYSGKQYSDSPRAIHEELVQRGVDVEHLWVVRDAQVELPETARPVRLWGAEWYEAMARSRYIVTNAHLPEWFVRRPGQVVVQTWHGTPLKRIGFDIEDVQFANPRYLEKVAKEAPNWSYLLSPNAFSTPILRRAFRYEGEIIETGYPRNDVLASPDRELLAERAWRQLLPPRQVPARHAPGPGAGGGRTRGRPCAPHPAAPQCRGHRPRGGGRVRPGRVGVPRHRRTFPDLGRPGHGLLVAHVRLRGHRPSHAVLHLRPGALPGRAARLLLRLRERGARPAAEDVRRGDRGPPLDRRRPPHLHRPLRTVHPTLLRTGRRQSRQPSNRPNPPIPLTPAPLAHPTGRGAHPHRSQNCADPRLEVKLG